MLCVCTVVNKAKIQNESNSQLAGIFLLLAVKLLSTKQRYKMKAIHNNFLANLTLPFTVVNKAKIQNESNSQQQKVVIKCAHYCCQQSKDTK